MDSAHQHSLQSPCVMYNLSNRTWKPFWGWPEVKSCSIVLLGLRGALLLELGWTPA